MSYTGPPTYPLSTASAAARSGHRMRPASGASPRTKFAVACSCKTSFSTTSRTRKTRHSRTLHPNLLISFSDADEPSPFSSKNMAVLLLVMLFLLLLAPHPAISTSPSAGDGTVCYNGCSGHGTCRHYHCDCDPGYHGEDCSTVFDGRGPTAMNDDMPATRAPLLVPLSVGAVRLTRRNFTRTARASRLLLVGVSSTACAKCGVAEPEYLAALDGLSELGVPFARVDYNTEHDLVRDDMAGFGAQQSAAEITLPALFACGTVGPLRRGSCIVYDGTHKAMPILAFARRMLAGSAAETLTSVSAIEAFVRDACVGSATDGSDAGDAESVAIGFFSDPEDAEEDEYSEFLEAALMLLPTTRVRVAQVFAQQAPGAMARYRQPKTPKRAQKKNRGKNKPGKPQPPRWWFSRTPAVVVMSCSGGGSSSSTTTSSTSSSNSAAGATAAPEAVYLDAFEPEAGLGAAQGGSLAHWIRMRSVPLAGELTPGNFPLYEAQGLPMAILFLNLGSGVDAPVSAAAASASPKKKTKKKKKSKKKKKKKKNRKKATSRTAAQVARRLGGGGSVHVQGTPNHAAVQALRSVASRFRARLVFAYIDGVQYADRMRTLGVLGGVDALPALAINMKGATEPLQPLILGGVVIGSNDSIASRLGRYCDAFLAGRLPKWSPANANAGQRLSAVGAEMETAAAERRSTGVREVFHEGDDSRIGVVPLSMGDGSFAEVALDETKDVLLLFHVDDGSCEACEHLAPYYKLLARRTADIGVDTLVVARMDLSRTPPPPEVHVDVPVIALLPAFRKSPKPHYVYYSGIAKVRPMMDWVQKHAARKINFGELPQFNKADKQLFKEQMRAREHARRSSNRIREL